MIAIVLSFDDQLEIANLVVESYNQLWPGCPFHFRIPYTRRDPRSILLSKNVEFVQTARDIRGTVESLLGGLADDEFVFWCIDDRYPIEIFDVQLLNLLYGFVRERPGNVDALKLTDATVVGPTVWRRNSGPGSGAAIVQGPRRNREQIIWAESPLILNGQSFVRQQGQSCRGFYMPQFMKAGLLRRFFLHPSLGPLYNMSEFHRFLVLQQITEAIYFPEKFLLALGESTISGKLTANCYEAILKLGLPLPNLPVLDKYCVYGTKKQVP